MGGRDHTASGNVTCPVCKEGNIMMCDNYRAIILLFTTYKILTNISYVKLVPYAEEMIGEYQGGMGYAVAQLVEAPRYKPEGLGFDSWWYHWIFSLA
jgi:hypothetical protein